MSPEAPFVTPGVPIDADVGGSATIMKPGATPFGGNVESVVLVVSMSVPLKSTVEVI